MKLYLLYIVKGKQNFKVGDNIKDFLEDKYCFDFKKPLDWNTDFSEEIHGAELVFKMKEGYFDSLTGKYHEPRQSDHLINSSMIICSASGKIHGIIKINKQDDKKEEI